MSDLTTKQEKILSELTNLISDLICKISAKSFRELLRDMNSWIYRLHVSAGKGDNGNTLFFIASVDRVLEAYEAKGKNKTTAIRESVYDLLDYQSEPFDELGEILKGLAFDFKEIGTPGDSLKNQYKALIPFLFDLCDYCKEWIDELHRESEIRKAERNKALCSQSDLRQITEDMVKSSQEALDQVREENKKIEEMLQFKKPQTQQNDILIIGIDDEEIPYVDFVKLAFDLETPDELAKHYQQILTTAKNTVKKTKSTWDRIIFLMNPETKRVRIWVD